MFFKKAKGHHKATSEGQCGVEGMRGAGARSTINPDMPALESQSRCVHFTWDYLSEDCFWFIITLTFRKENWPNQ